LELTESKLITLFEHQAVSYELLDITDIDLLLDEIDKINQTAKIDLIKLERKGLRTFQYVGIIQAGSYLIQILPKIDCDPAGSPEAPNGSLPKEIAVRSAAHNFLHLLRHTHNLKLHHQVLATLYTSSGTWMDMLIHMFTSELMIQFQLGFHQEFVRMEELLPYVRGRWNIARQFSNHPNLVDGLDVSYDDYSPDTNLNRVFHLAVNMLKYVTRDPNNRQRLANLESWLVPVQIPSQLNSSDLDRIEFNRLNERFKPSFLLARLFLEGQTVQLLAGGQRSFALVFDMNRLFEQFVSNILQTYAHRILPSAWIDCQIELQGGSPQRFLIDSPYPSERPLFHLKPDILIKSLGVPLLIIDTKNKGLFDVSSYRDISESDVYQMIAYAELFGCPNILLLYPRTYGAIQNEPYSLSINGTNIRIFVATLDLHQPLDSIDCLVLEIRNLLDYINLHEVNPKEVIWPS